MRRELEPAFFRPKIRRLSDLTNDELVLLFRKRAEAIADELNEAVWADSCYLVYWGKFIDLQDALYEIMMEIQSRCPAGNIKDWHRLLPVVEPERLDS